MTLFHKLFSFVAILALAVLLAGCPSGGNSVESTSSGKFTETGSAKSVGGTAAANAQKIFAANSGGAESGKNDDYKIAPLDVVEITVFGVAELNRTAQVSTSGMISLPLIKTVRAGGRTQAQLERDIAQKLEAGFLQSPQVSVYVKEYNSQRITVDGAVNKPGIYPTTGKVSLLQAIALAEGLSAVADPSGILLFRTVDNKRLVARFDLKQVRSGKVDDPALQAGDIVMVDDSATRTTLRDIKDVLPLSGLFQLLLL
jgi:polysaccharide biosynthesis/export protein